MFQTTSSVEQLKSQIESGPFITHVLFWAFNLTLLIFCGLLYYLVVVSQAQLNASFDDFIKTVITLVAVLNAFGAVYIPKLIAKFAKHDELIIGLIRAKDENDRKNALAKLQVFPHVQGAFEQLEQRDQIRMLLQGQLYLSTLLSLVFSETVTIFGFLIAWADGSVLTIVPFAAVSLALNMLHTRPKLGGEYISQVIRDLENRASMQL
jgi:hypothetical protein